MKKEKTLATMTVHEQTKEIVKTLPPFSATEWKQVEEDLVKFLDENSSTKNFMLLSNEIRYYTIFKVENVLLTTVGMAEKMMKFINKDEFLKSLGKIKVFKKTETGEMEIWIGETHFLLFDVDSFFVSI